MRSTTYLQISLPLPVFAYYSILELTNFSTACYLFQTFLLPPNLAAATFRPCNLIQSSLLPKDLAAASRPYPSSRGYYHLQSSLLSPGLTVSFRACLLLPLEPSSVSRAYRYLRSFPPAPANRVH